MINVNPIAAKNNTIVTLHLNDEEHDSKGLAPYSELHADDNASFHRVSPTPLSIKLVFPSSSSSLPSFLKMEYDIKLMAVPPSTSILEIGFPSM
jgi:hypothetical protein